MTMKTQDSETRETQQKLIVRNFKKFIYAKQSHLRK